MVLAVLLILPLLCWVALACYWLLPGVLEFILVHLDISDFVLLSSIALLLFSHALIRREKDV